MRLARQRQDIGLTIEADTRFHHLLLVESGNPIVTQLAVTVDATLRVTGLCGTISEQGVTLRLDLADTLAMRDPNLAEAAAVRLMDHVQHLLERSAGKHLPPVPTGAP